MGQNKKKKQQPVKKELPNQEVLDSIGSPNTWTPDIEDAWLNELSKITTREIYSRFPPMRKPSNVRKRGSSYGWG